MSLFQDSQNSTNRAKLICRKQLEVFKYVSAIIKEQARIITPDVATALGADAEIVTGITTAMLTFCNTVAPLIGKPAVTSEVTPAPTIISTVSTSTVATAGTVAAPVVHPATVTHTVTPAGTHSPVIHPVATAPASAAVAPGPVASVVIAPAVPPHPAMPASSSPAIGGK